MSQYPTPHTDRLNSMMVGQGATAPQPSPTITNTVSELEAVGLAIYNLTMQIEAHLDGCDTTSKAEHVKQVRPPSLQGRLCELVEVGRAVLGQLQRIDSRIC